MYSFYTTPPRNYQCMSWFLACSISFRSLRTLRVWFSCPASVPLRSRRVTFASRPALELANRRRAGSAADLYSDARTVSVSTAYKNQKNNHDQCTIRKYKCLMGRIYEQKNGMGYTDLNSFCEYIFVRLSGAEGVTGDVGARGDRLASARMSNWV